MKRYLEIIAELERSAEVYRQQIKILEDKNEDLEQINSLLQQWLPIDESKPNSSIDSFENFDA